MLHVAVSLENVIERNSFGLGNVPCFPQLSPRNFPSFEQTVISYLQERSDKACGNSWRAEILLAETVSRHGFEN